MSWLLGVILFFVIGGVIGWLASMVMNRDAQMGKFWNVVVGIVGSWIGNGIGSQVLGFGEGSIAAWPPDFRGLLAAFVGAIVLLLVLNLMQRGRAR